MKELTLDELKVVSELTFELTKLKQNECKHLCVENFAPPLLKNLIAVVKGEEIELMT